MKGYKPMQSVVTDLPLHDQQYRRDLGDGLVLRWSGIEDTDKLTQLYGHVFRRDADSPNNKYLEYWTRDLMSGTHPNASPDDFAVVEDTATGNLVAATGLMHQQITYDGIPMTLGRPEIVGSEIPYRNKGLIRDIFGLIHARSEARGHLLQGITGIPYYYRQFGYEYAVWTDGNHHVFFDSIPPLKEGEQELFAIRHATVDDIPMLMDLHNREQSGMVILHHPEAEWRWALTQQRVENGNVDWIIQNGEGHGIGYVATSPQRWADLFRVNDFMVLLGQSLYDAALPVLRQLKRIAPDVPARRPDTPLPVKFHLCMRDDHPLLAVLGSERVIRGDRTYAWYMRIPDPVAFLRHILPVLNARLGDSPLSGYSGTLMLTLFREEIHFVLERGQITSIEAQRPVPFRETQASCPPLVFNQLALGHRDFDALADIYPDVTGNREGTLLMQALFPAKPSYMMGEFLP
jgi:Acetyltransferase (GNAT) domain